MSNLRQAAQRALKAMEDGEYRADMIEFSDALIALRAALAEPEQELGQALKQAIEHINELEALNAELVEALRCADAMLSGANMDAKAVERKVAAALAKVEASK